jgi:hypothetical protein
MLNPMDRRKPSKKSRNCERKSASTTGCITRKLRQSSATANTTASTRSSSISKRSFPIWLRPIRPLNASAENRLKRLRANPHRAPMLSLDNTYSEEEVEEFLQTNHAPVAERKNPGGDRAKSGRRCGFGHVRKRQAEVCSDARRWNVGDDITQNIKTIRSVPHQLRGAAPKLFEVRGEAYWINRL